MIIAKRSVHFYQVETGPALILSSTSLKHRMGAEWVYTVQQERSFRCLGVWSCEGYTPVFSLAQQQIQKIWIRKHCSGITNNAASRTWAALAFGRGIKIRHIGQNRPSKDSNLAQLHGFGKCEGGHQFWTFDRIFCQTLQLLLYSSYTRVLK